MINPCPSHQTLFIVTPSHQPTWILKTLHSHFFVQGTIRITWEPSPETWFQSWEIQHRWLSYYFASPLNAVHVLFMCVSLHFTQPSTYSQHLIFVWPFATQSTPLTWICFNWSQDQWEKVENLSVCLNIWKQPPLYMCTLCTLCTLCTHNSQVYTFYLKCLITFLKNWWTRDGTGSHLVTFANVNSFESIYLGFWVLVVFPFLRTSFIPPKSE